MPAKCKSTKAIVGQHVYVKGMSRKFLIQEYMKYTSSSKKLYIVDIREKKEKKWQKWKIDVIVSDGMYYSVRHVFFSKQGINVCDSPFSVTLSFNMRWEMNRSLFGF